MRSIRSALATPGHVSGQHTGSETVHGGTADTGCAPGYTPMSLSNGSATDAPFSFIADETPLYRKLGVFEVRN